MLKSKKQAVEESNKANTENAEQKQLRVWPGVVFVILMLLARFGLKIVMPGYEGFEMGIYGGMIGILAVVVWWIFFSRAPWSERLAGFGLMIVAMFVTWQLKHESMGPFWLVAYAIPFLCVALVIGAVISRRYSTGRRRVSMAASILLVCGVWLLFRTSGIDGDHVADFSWRWVESTEEQLVAKTGDKIKKPPSTSVITDTTANWPGFRGRNRDGVIPGVQIDTDWSASPPVELWRRPIGPGWSSFAVHGDLLYTQEQRGEEEVVSCYTVTTGEPVWKHSDAARFFESNAGAGPRGTPTFSDGFVCTLGATGIVNMLDAGDGTVIWSRNAASDTDTKVPIWGFSGSPLIVDDMVIVAVASSLIAYDRTTGEQRWFNTVGSGCYSSPHLLSIDGVTQVLLMNETGAISVKPADGEKLWEHSLPGDPIVQPALTDAGDILITASERSGVRRLAVKQDSGSWTIKERWTSTRLKPYFNDFVVHKGHVYGFDSRILACMDVEQGKRKWKGGRYGCGQLVLLADQDLLIVLSEKGELALVKATPDKFTELTRFPVVKGKTWNHPVLINNVLLVRNSDEMAAFRLSLVGG